MPTKTEGMGILTHAEISDLFKQFQARIKKKAEFEQGKEYLLKFRKSIWDIYNYIFDTATAEEYSAMPLRNDKTIAYFIYHTNRIEDITSNTLILEQEQIFYQREYQKRLGSPIATTGNELCREQLVGFSQSLNIDELKNYVKEVFAKTTKLIEKMTFEESKTKITPQVRERLIELNSVSTDETAFWLVDYWCKKDYCGLLLMPFSRHQLLHLNGCLRIIEKLKKQKS
ncbi:MAG: phage head-tail adapter protein [Oscillospiraceae bacterium]|jgi:hypothetical protein|nr:phage head-tail adapter protein [Oscillospiraceae bacterium]